jgi:antirestriction protein ArdC
MADNKKTEVTQSAEEKKTNKQRLKDITDSIENGIKELFNSDKYKQYLQTMSRFHRYSVNNQMLIYMQNPNATLVAGFNKWHDQFGRNVKKGEKGIKIIAPTPYKKKIEETKLDPDTKLPILDDNGNEVKVEKEIQIPMFRVVSVFDVSQTVGKPLPQLASDLSGNVQNYDAFLEAIKRSSSVPITFEPISNADGYFSLDEQKIVIRDGMSEVQTVSALLHELAHSKLHNISKDEKVQTDGQNADKPKLDRNTEEVQAESISFAVCAYYGIKTDENSFGYIASWSESKELSELKASLETINKTSSAMITDIDKHYAEVKKERGLDNEQLDLDEAPSDLPDPNITLADMNAYGYNYENMLPLTKDVAQKLFDMDAAVYMLHYDNTESMVLDTSEIKAFDGILGIEKADWEAVKDNYLKNAEMSIEDDFNMIDGIINNGDNRPTVAELECDVKAGKPISLLDLADAIEKESKESKQHKPHNSADGKPSLLAKLNRPLPQQDKTQQKSKEREM